MSNTTQNCVCRLRNRNILISLLFLLVSSLIHQRIPLVEGRPISKLSEASVSQKLGQVEDSKNKVVVSAARVRQIGSRPPRCERLCGACTRCEAVQVPVAPQQRLQINSGHKIRSRSLPSSSRHGVGNGGTTSSEVNYNGQKKINNNKNVEYYRRDDFSNYKPMGWKCKCGNFFFNP